MKAESMRALRARLWRAFHNVVAHPLMEVLPAAWGDVLHDWTARRAFIDLGEAERPGGQGHAVVDTPPADARTLEMPDQVSTLKPWQTVEFEHFVGVRHASGTWTHVILKPTGETLDIEAAGKRVQLHGNGIEFLPSESTQASILPLRPRGPDGEPEGGA